MENFIEDVYYSLTGNLIEPVAGVEDTFAEGTLCAKSYQNIYDANIRLCKRLHVLNEDQDIEIMIHSFFEIQRELCLKMYEYGAKFGMR